MCIKVECNDCKKPTWKGCGMHIEQALAGVPVDQRCKCRDTNVRLHTIEWNGFEYTWLHFRSYTISRIPLIYRHFGKFNNSRHGPHSPIITLVVLVLYNNISRVHLRPHFCVIPSISILQPSVLFVTGFLRLLRLQKRVRCADFSLRLIWRLLLRMIDLSRRTCF